MGGAGGGAREGANECYRLQHSHKQQINASTRWYRSFLVAEYIIEIKIHSSCEIEDSKSKVMFASCFDTPIARITGFVSSLSLV